MAVGPSLSHDSTQESSGPGVGRHRVTVSRLRPTQRHSRRTGSHVAEGMRLMAVHAHPDDESSKGAATTAKYVADGRHVMVVSCTGGERGDILNPKLKDDPHILRDIAQVRRDEMKAAQDVLGVRAHVARFRRLRPARGRPAAAAARRLLRAGGHRRDDRGARAGHPRASARTS